MPRPSDDTLVALRGAATEIGAGKVLRPRSDLDDTWNAAHDRALAIIAEGCGLFQMAARRNKKVEDASGLEPESVA